MRHRMKQRMKQHARKVRGNRRAVAAARVHPRLRRSKKAPPMSLVPPRPQDGKKLRHHWQIAKMIADADADASGDTDTDTDAE